MSDNKKNAIEKKRLGVKDFITVGIFTAIIFVVEFACGMLGYIHPYIVVSYVVMIPLVGCIPMMLFYTKVEKFGMITIMSVLIAIIMFVTGMGYLGAPLIIIAGVIADLIARSGGYKFINFCCSYNIPRRYHSRKKLCYDPTVTGKQRFYYAC